MLPACMDRARVEQLEVKLRLLPQIELTTQHVFHAGVYARTITIPAGVTITGAVIKRATLLIVNGDALASNGAESVRFTGYNVVPARAGRKTAWHALEETQLTMIFSTSARTVEAVEREFTDDVDSLMSHRNLNNVCVTED